MLPILIATASLHLFRDYFVLFRFVSSVALWVAEVVRFGRS